MLSLSTPDVLTARWEELQAQSDALASEGQRYAEYFNFAPAPYIVTDGEGTILAANYAAGELLGRCAAGRPIGTLVAPDERAAFRARFGLLRAGQGEASPRWNSALRGRGGERIAASLHVRPVEREAGAPRSYCWLIALLPGSSG